MGEDLVKYYRNSSQYYCLFFSVNGVALVNTTVTFNIHGVFYSRTTNATGWARLNINLDPGNYIITAFNPVSGETHANSITVLSTIVDNHDLVKYYRNNSQYVVRILGPTGCPVGAGENVTFNINGVFYTRTTNSSGHAKLNINLGPGDYIVTVYYSSCAVSNNICVLSTLISEDLYMGYFDGSCFEVKVLDDVGNPYPNQTVNFNVKGVFYNRVSDNYGIARLKINLQPGEYIITFSFNDLVRSNLIHISTARSTILININGNITKFYGENKYFTVKLTNTNHVLSNKIVKFNVNNIVYNIKTNNEGLAIFNIDLKPDIYNIVAKFEGDNGIIGSNIIYGKITINKSNSILYCNHTKITDLEENYLTFHLVNNLGSGIFNQSILISLDNHNYTLKTNSIGYAKLKINNSDEIGDFNACYNGNDYYLNTSVNEILNVTYNSFKYGIIIPHYINISGMWRVVDSYGYLNSDYISVGGVGGKVKVFVSREICILTNKGETTYTIGNTDNDNHIEYDGFRDLIFDNYDLSKIHIESNKNYTNITYYSYLINETNQFSTIYRQKTYNGTIIPDYEELLLIKNGVTQASISFTNPLNYDEYGVRAALMWNHFDPNYLYKPYNQFNNYDSLFFSETEEHINYTNNYQKINNFPSKERINTFFEFNDCEIYKDEWVSFGKHHSLSNNYEVIQTFAITNSLVDNESIKYYLKKNNTVNNEVEKAYYETFLTALSTIWMYDGLVKNLSEYYNVSYCRNQFVISMCGMEYGNVSYIHCPNPLMGISVYGESWINIYIIKYLSSLMLGEIESSIMNMAGGCCNSSVYEIFSRILNLENFTVIYSENKLTICLKNNSNYKIIIDLEKGIVYDLTCFNGFLYKGAFSQDFNYCYCYDVISHNLEGLTNQDYPPIYNKESNFTITEDEWNIIEDIIGDFAISTSFATITPFIPLLLIGAPVGLPIYVAAGLLVVGVIFKSSANNFNPQKSSKELIISICSNLVLV